MADFVHKEKGGSIFRNNYKTKETQPSHKGDCKIGGVDYWISAWVNDSKNGKYFNLKFEVKEEKYQTGDAAPLQHESVDLDDDIPF
jgi:hypothetical protein